MKLWSVVFAALAVLLSDVMCAVVAFFYCDNLWGIAVCGNSAPAEVAFFLAIPFLVGIAVCVLLSVVCWKKSNRNAKAPA